MAYGPSQLVNRDGFDLGKTLLQRNGIVPLEGRLIKELIKHNTVSGHAMLCKTSFVKQNLPIRTHRVGSDNEVLYDYYFALCANFQNGIQYVPQALTFHRMHTGNLTNNPEAMVNKNQKNNFAFVEKKVKFELIKDLKKVS